MDTTLPTPPRKSSWWRRSLLGLLLAGVLALLGHALWLPALATAALPGLARRFAGLELEVEVLELSSSRIELGKLRAAQPGAEPILADLRLEALRLEFSLSALLEGDLEGLARLEIDGLQLDLRLDRLPVEPATDDAMDDAPPAQLALPAHLPLLEIDARRVSVTLPGEARLFSAGGRIAADAEGQIVVDGVQLELPAQDEAWTSRPLTLSGRWQRGVVEDTELRVAGTRLLRESRVDLVRVLEGAVGLDLMLELGSGSSSLQAAIDGQGASFDLRLERAELSALHARAPFELPLELRGRLELEGHAELEWQDWRAARASAEFELEGLRALERSVTRCAGSATLEDGWLEVPQLTAHQERNSVTLSALRWPLFTAERDDWLHDASASLSVVIEDLAAITGPLPLPERYTRLPAHELRLAGHMRAGRAELESGSLTTSGGTVELTRATLQAGQTWDEPWSLDVRARSDLEHLDQVGLLVGRDDWWGRLQGTLEAHGTWPELSGSWQLDGRNLRFGPVEVGSLAVQLEADGRELRLAHARASGSGLSLEASGVYSLERARLQEGLLALDIPRLVDWVPEVFESGSARLNARFTGGLDTLQTDAEVETEGISIGGVAFQNTRAEFTGDGRSWRCDSLHAETDFGALEAAFALEFDAGWRLARAALASFELARDEQGLRLVEPSELALTYAGEAVSGSWNALRLAGEAGSLEVSGSFTPAELELDVTARGLHPDVFLAGTSAALPKLASIDGRAHVAGPRDAPLFDSSGELEALYLPGASAPGDLAWSLRRDGQRLVVDQLRLEGAGELELSIAGSLPLEALQANTAGELACELHANLPLDELAAMSGVAASFGARGRVRVDGNLGGSLDGLTGALDVSGEELRWPAQLHPASVGDGSFSGSIEIDEGLRVEGLQLALGELLDLRLDLRVEATTSPRAYVEDHTRALEQASFEAVADIGTLDLQVLSRAFGELWPALESLRAGTLSGEARASGSLLAPDLAGTLQLSDGSLRLGSGLPTADAVQAELLLDGESFRIGSLTGELGGAPFELSGEAVLAAAELELHFRLTGDDLLLFRNREARVRAGADLSIDGPLSALAVAGSLEFSDGRFSPTTDFLDLRGGSKAHGARGFQLFHLREAPLSTMSFDIALSSRAPFVVRNTVIRGSVRPDLHLGGTGLLPILTGTVYLDRTLMRLPASSLELTGGTVIFDENDPFQPEVEINARTRLMGYDIKASISGAYDSPEILLSSTPPLSQESLLLLVLTGRLPDDPDQTDPLATANTVALYLAKDSLARWFTDEGPMNEDSLFNRFEFSTGRDVSRNGVETVDITFRVTEKEGLPPDRRDYRHVYLAGQRDRFEDYNFGLRLVFRLR